VSRVASFGEAPAGQLLLVRPKFSSPRVTGGTEMTADGINVTILGGRWCQRAQEDDESPPGHRRNGEWLQLGEYDAGVVIQAIRYAADRRVVATTITAGDGKINWTL